MNQRNQAEHSKKASGSSGAAATRAVRPRLIIMAALVAAGAGYGLYRWQTHRLTGPTIVATDRIQVPEPARDVDPAVPAGQTRPAANSLRRERGTPLSPTLLTRPSDDGRLWYVGKPTTESLVEIPFPPGLKPGAPPVMEFVRENPGFLGAQACQSCHRDKYETFVHTAHHLTSRPGMPEFIRGSFEPGENRMRTANPDLVFTMIQRNDRCYQKVNFYDWEFEVPIDLVTGSSKLAQTFLFWDFDALYQMNVTHLTESDRWINSPGYFDGDAAYARPIGARCLECHTTYADFRRQPNHFTPNSLILGVSCERCHGPGRPHVAYHLQHPEEKAAKFVSVPTDFPRQRQLDICGQCHSGASDLKGLPYSFRPGDRLDDHYHPIDQAELQNSVHASNQASRLAISKCFKQSEMACADCHNPHRKERGQTALFSSRCIKCHAPEHCGQSESLGDAIRDNCIDCHMPNEQTQNMRLETPEGDVFPPLRDHYIRIDAKATERYLSELAD